MFELQSQPESNHTDFDLSSDRAGIYLTDAARRVFLQHFEERMMTKIAHPDIQETVYYRRAIHLQIQRYKRDRYYQMYLMKRF